MPASSTLPTSAPTQQSPPSFSQAPFNLLTLSGPAPTQQASLPLAASSQEAPTPTPFPAPAATFDDQDGYSYSNPSL